MPLYISKRSILYSRTKKDHWRDLKSVLAIFEREKLIAKPNKFQFMAQELLVLI